MGFNPNTTPMTDNYIPHSVIKSIKHYPNNILIITYLPYSDGTGPVLYVTKEFTTDANGITGTFEKQPE